MRIVIAAIFSALMLFIWGFVAHTVLPIGEMGVQAPANEEVILDSVKSGAPNPGIYVLPYVSSAQWKDEAFMKAFAEKSKAQPFVYMVVSPPYGDPMQMTPQLVKQFGSNFLGSLIAAWLLVATRWGFAARVLGATTMGVFVWVGSVVPMAVWYRFPTDFMIAGLIEHVVGWLLGGIVIAWWLGRSQPRRI
ncbi:MAG: hypothetical protein BGP25_01850 [Lysobacterales bacterium 63-13]|nr:MAG: hypothetical protein BGP25_01850 [Xanthomonadales bacterium 63-13]